MKIICISGKAQHGKDTTAEIIKEQLTAQGASVLIAHYGDLLKYMCRTFFDWDGKKDERGRQILQHVGTDVIRKQRPSFWADFITETLTMFPDAWDYVLIPDCRFPNEIESVRSAGFDVTHLRVVRANFTSPLTAEQQAHQSEIALDHVTPDAYIANDGTLADLAQVVARWLTQST